MGTSCNTSETGIGISVLPITQLDAILSVAVVGLKATVSIAMPVADVYKYSLWLSDSATDPTPSLTTPTEPVQTVFEGYTAANGTKSIEFTNSGAARTWYLWGYFQRIDVSSAITAGV